MKLKTIAAIPSLAIALCGAAPAETLADRAETWLQSRPVTKWDRDSGETTEARHARLRVVAEVVAELADGNRLIAAALLVQGDAESGWRLDVAECRCPPHQCDEGRALNYTQNHPTAADGFGVRALWCGAGHDPVLATMSRTAARFRGVVLEEGFRSQGGDRAKVTDQWVVSRAAEARRLAGKL